MRSVAEQGPVFIKVPFDMVYRVFRISGNKESGTIAPKRDVAVGNVLVVDYCSIGDIGELVVGVCKGTAPCVR